MAQNALELIKIRIRLFGNWRDLVGSDALEIEMPYGSSLTDLINLLASRYGAEFLDDLVDRQTGAFWSPLSLALNGKALQEPSELSTRLNDGDEVMFLFPIYGG